MVNPSIPTIFLQGRNMKDIIEEYIRIVEKYLDAPSTFIRASAYHVVSSLLGQYFWCPHIGSSQGGLHPNTWFILSSIPGRTRRSTVAGYANKVYKDALITYHMNKEPEPLNKSDATKLMFNTIIEEGTPEGIMDHICMNKKINSYAIMSSEFGSVLTRMSTKESQVGVSSLLSKLYYGEGGIMLLSQRGKEARGRRFLPEGLYVTMLAGMQEPHYYLTPTMIRQGLLRRIMLIYTDPKDIDRWQPPIETWRGNVDGDLKNFSNYIVEKMYEYVELAEQSQTGKETIQTLFVKDAYNFINNFAKKNDEELGERVTDYGIYKQGFWEQITKIAILHSISRDGIEHGEHLSVNINDVKKAYDFVISANKHSSEILSNLSRVDRPIESSYQPIERVYTVIENAGKEGISRSELYRKTNMTSRVLTELVSTLIAQERVEFEKQETGGKPTILYRVK